MTVTLMQILNLLLDFRQKVRVRTNHDYGARV